MKDIKHIAFIMDGNRRYAKKHNLGRLKGHDIGAEIFMRVIDLFYKNIFDVGTKELTFYAFSVQNFNREKVEVDYLMNLFVKIFREFKKRFLEEYNYDICFKFVGRKHLFNSKIKRLVCEIEDMTKNNSKLLVNVAFGYGGQEEIVDGIKCLFDDFKSGVVDFDFISNLTVDDFRNYLQVKSYPDLIIRTSGEFRTSNFLSWQSSYSEWYFEPKFWPELDEKTIFKILDNFRSRSRRFGK